MYTFFTFSHNVFMKNSVGKGAFVLAISGFICKFLGALFRLPLTNIIGIQGIGIFQMIMSLYSLMLVFVSNGVTNSLSKLVSSARAKGQNFKIGGFFRSSILFCITIGFLIGIFFFVFSKELASLQGFNGGEGTYMLFIVLLPTGGIIGAFRGIIQGFENMTPTAISQIIEQLIKFIFGLFFAFLLKDKGQNAGVLGAFLGISLGEIIALIYLLVIVIKKIKIKPIESQVKNEFFKAVLPLSFSSAIIPLTHAIESLIIVSLFLKAGFNQSQATTLYGLQTGVVGAILNFPMIISFSIAVALLPKISFLFTQNDIKGQKENINKAFNIMWFLLIPIVIGICSIAQNLYPIIYPSIIEGYLKIAVQLTFLGALSIILASINQFLFSILQAQGFFSYSLFFNIIGGIAKISTLIFLSPIKQISIFSIVISNIVMFSIISICTLIKIGYIVNIDFFDFLLPILSSIAMFLGVKIILLYFSGILSIILAIIIGATLYFILSYPLTKKYSLLIIHKLKKVK